MAVPLERRTLGPFFLLIVCLTSQKVFVPNVVVYSSNYIRLVGMCKRFTLSKGELLNPKFEGDIHITSSLVKTLLVETYTHIYI